MSVSHRASFKTYPFFIATFSLYFLTFYWKTLILYGTSTQNWNARCERNPYACLQKNRRVSSFTSMPAPKWTPRLSQQINSFDATKLQDRALVQATRRFSRCSNSAKRDDLLVTIFANLRGVCTRRMFFQSGASEMVPKWTHFLFFFLRVGVLWKSASRQHENAILHFVSIEHVDFLRKSTSLFWAWRAGKTWISMFSCKIN